MANIVCSLQSHDGTWGESNEALRQLERNYGVIDVVITSLEVSLEGSGNRKSSLLSSRGHAGCTWESTLLAVLQPGINFASDAM